MTKAKRRSLMRFAKNKFGENGELLYLLRKHASYASVKCSKGRVFDRIYSSYKNLKNASSLFSLLEKLNSPTSLTKEELSKISDALSLCALMILADKKSKATHAERLAHALCLLRLADRVPFDLFYDRLYICVKILSEECSFFELCDAKTRHMMISYTERFAQKHKVSLSDASHICAKAFTEKNGVPISSHRKSSFLKVLYFLLIYLPSLACVILLPFVKIPLFFSFFLFLPCVFTFKQLTDRIYAFALTRTAYQRLQIGSIQKFELEKIPQNAKTTLVITCLLSKEDTSLFDKLERYYLANKSDNLSLGLLCDLQSADSPILQNDDVIFDFAKRETKKLNKKYGNVFFCAIRKRTYSASEGVYSGRERKRGALCDFTMFIKDSFDDFALFCGDYSIVKGARYTVTLDSDSEPLLHGIFKLVGAMMHPYNKPLIRNGRVVKGFAVMQPKMEITPEAASASRFSVLFCGSGGIDQYSSASFEIYQSLFGSGIYCGKGIYDNDAFYTLLTDMFAPETVLSHDLLEGEILRCAYVSDVVFADSFPKNPISYYSRAHRWIRGDVQTLAYAFGKIRNFSRKRIKNPISAIGKYKIFDNIRRHITPIFTLACLLASLFYGNYVMTVVFFVCTSYLFLPFVLNIFSKKSFEPHFSHILTGIVHTLAHLLFSLSAIVKDAITSIDALFRSLFRMLISHRKLLEWTTADTQDKMKNTLKTYLRESVLPISAGMISLTFSLGAAMKIMGIFWIFFPLCLLLLSKPYTQGMLSKSKKAILSRWCFDHWKFYEDCVSAEDNYLPPDNIQFPEGKIAHRTSPTNIGMYLVSTLAARDFGFITSAQMASRLDLSIDTLFIMPRSHGHFYNWYNTENLSVIGDAFVSSVDSGNLAVCLASLKSGIAEYENEAPSLALTAQRIQKLLDGMDFSVLYDEKRELFAITSDFVSTPSAFYDLYMSEARLLSYYAISRGQVPPEHWNKLSRSSVKFHGTVGVISWSGTAFEYFMPALFLPVIQGSLFCESLAFAAHVQSKHRYHSFFGISESAFYSFDADMNYQYKAHGIKSLALDPFAKSSKVISPYSSFIMLRSAGSAAITNLSNLKAYGMYGKYGFFEALDLEKTNGTKGAVIMSYMAHHVGMSMVACANACFDNIFAKRFMKDGQSASASLLLREKIPTHTAKKRKIHISPAEKDIGILKKPTHSFKDAKGTKNYSHKISFALLSNLSVSALASSVGHVYLFSGNKALTYPCFDRYDAYNVSRSLAVIYSQDNQSARMLTPSRFSASKSAVSLSDGIAELKISICARVNVYCLHFSCKADKSAKAALSFTPILANINDYKRQPSFCGLKTDAFVKDGILFYRFRDPLCYLAIAALDCSKPNDNMSFEATTSETALPFEYDKDDLLSSFEKSSRKCNQGALISPYCMIKKRLAASSGRASCDFLIAYSKSEKGAYDMIMSLKNNGKKQIFKQVASSLDESMTSLMSSGKISINRFTGVLLKTAYLSKPPLTDDPTPYPKDKLWSFGISGDDPIMMISLPESKSFTPSCDRICEYIIRASTAMRRMEAKLDIIFVCPNEDSYERPTYNRIERLASIFSLTGEHIPKGVFILDHSAKPIIQSSASLCVTLFESSSPETLCADLENLALAKKRKTVTNRTEENEKIHAYLSERAKEGHTTRGGIFTSDSFIAYKKCISAPWSYIYSGQVFGTLLTQSSLGFTFFRNSAENRLSKGFSGGAYNRQGQISGERLILDFAGESYDLCALSEYTEYTRGYALYRFTPANKKIDISVYVGVDIKLPVKMICVRNVPLNAKLSLEVLPDLGSSGALYKEVCDSTVFYKKPSSYRMSDITMFVSASKTADDNTSDHLFLIGCYKDGGKRTFEYIKRKYRSCADALSGYAEYAKYYADLFAKCSVNFKDTNMSIMAEYYLPYQVLVSRLYARCGFYQSGGAWGFRDQLQDSLAMLDYDANICKIQILRSAARQYTDGSVQHWWLTPRDRNGTRFGQKSHCSDDMLWLVYASCRYFEHTGDRDIFNIKLRYISSPELAPDEASRCESVGECEYRESLYYHCLRALEYALKKGENGLLKIGSGDWNDSFDRLGVKGIGTSVWLSMFTVIVLRHFYKVAERFGNERDLEFINENIESLLYAVNKTRLSDRFPRAFSDDGIVIGANIKGAVCDIDILPQAFAVLAECDGAKEAINKGFSALYDSSAKILKLFTPPFPYNRTFAGYVNGYSDGVRENGGQYTHAAVWAAMALFEAGETEKGRRLLEDINPIFRSRDPVISEIYKTEPYALCGDVYSAKGFEGRGGWSLYTGSAAWYLYAIKKYLQDRNEENEGKRAIIPKSCAKDI